MTEKFTQFPIPDFTDKELAGLPADRQPSPHAVRNIMAYAASVSAEIRVGMAVAQ